MTKPSRSRAIGRLLSLPLLVLQLSESRQYSWGLPVSLMSRLESQPGVRSVATVLSLSRGGSQTDPSSLVETPQQPADGDAEESLDEKVRRAMEKLGLTPPSVSSEDSVAPITPDSANGSCEGGVCELPPTSPTTATTTQDPEKLAELIASSMSIDRSLAMAAVAATASRQGETMVFNEIAARQMILQELQVISTVPEDCEEVKQLVQEGNSVFEARRALAFADGNMENARAILLAEREDARMEEEEEQAAVAGPPEPAFTTVEVKSDFDPTKLAQTEPPKAAPAPQPADKSKVVFEATSKQIQELVLESPVPVLLDVYADWCGPCKVLGPALEEMAVKSGGAFRLVKVNTDNERPVSAALEVTALPTVFGVKNGRIVNVFQGMPRSQEAMQSFMMGLLVNESHFNPPVTEQQKAQFDELTSKLVKMAGSACFSFAARERLQDRVTTELDKLVEQTGDFSVAEESTQVLRSLLANVIRDPTATKFRSVKLDNKVIATKVKQYPACLAILKSVGFSAESDSELVLHKRKAVVNVAPLIVARDTIDKWLDASRYEVAKAARKRKDELDRIQVQKELEEAKKNAPDATDDEEDEPVDPDACTIKVRIEGKKKVHELHLRAEDTLSSVLTALPVSIPEGRDVKITCAAKRLVMNASDENVMHKSLRELDLLPTASIVVAILSEQGSSARKKTSKSSISERATKKKKKKGSHTMQSVGIYAEDDNAKGELIDGGGGVWYEHDVSDNEEEKVDDKEPPSKPESDASEETVEEVEAAASETD